MKRIKFETVFLAAAVVIFIASKRSALSSILLMLASAYMIFDVLFKYAKERNDAKRKSDETDNSN